MVAGLRDTKLSARPYTRPRRFGHGLWVFPWPLSSVTFGALGAVSGRAIFFKTALAFSVREKNRLSSRCTRVGFLLIGMIEGEVIADDGYDDGIILRVEAMLFAPLDEGLGFRMRDLDPLARVLIHRSFPVAGS